MFEKAGLSDVANSFTINLMFYICDYYNIDVNVALDLIDKTGYWTVLNNTVVCATVAHDGVARVFEENLKEKCDAILSV